MELRNTEHIDFLLSVSFHSFFGPSWQLEVQGDSLTWVKSLNGETTEEKNSSLNPEQIKSFLYACEKAGVFSWEPHYLHCCMLDGSTWSLTVKAGERTVRSGGTNGYPDTWADFSAALAKLAELPQSP